MEVLASFFFFSPCWTTITSRLPATYWTNPQFKIHLDEVDEDQEEGTSEPCCTVLLGLMQKNRRRQRRIGQGMLSIGYAVYQVSLAQAPLSQYTAVFMRMFWSTTGEHLSYCSNSLTMMLSLLPYI